VARADGEGSWFRSALFSQTRMSPIRDCYRFGGPENLENLNHVESNRLRITKFLGPELRGPARGDECY